MSRGSATPSAREVELVEAAYAYVLEHGLSSVSLRPLAAAIGSSPRVLLYLFGSKDGVIQALLARARVDELSALADVGCDSPNATLADAAMRIWEWLVCDEHRPLLRLWLEGYARALIEPEGPWAGFAAATVEDWLSLLAKFQRADARESEAGSAERTGVLAILRGSVLDLLATGDADRVTAAVGAAVERL